MSDIETHFEDIVVRAWRNYLKAEDALSGAIKNGGTVEINEAKKEVVLSGRSASIEMHQFADTIAAQTENLPEWLPEGVRTVDGVRKAVSEHCKMLRNIAPWADVDLLHDIADAFKHSILTNPRKGREHWVKTAKCSVVISTGYGELGYGEGKESGSDQVIIRLENGRCRALSSILQNVIDAWRTFMGQELPDFNR